MKNTEQKKLLLILASAYWLLALMIFGIAHEQFDHIGVESDALSATMTTGELYDGHKLSQSMTIPADTLTGVSLMTVPSAETNGVLKIELSTDDEAALAAAEIKVRDLTASKYSYVQLDKPITGRLGETVTLTLTTEGCEPGKALIVYFGDSVIAGKFDIVKDIDQSDCFIMDGVQGQGVLCIKLSGEKHLGLQGLYWAIVIGFFAVVAVAFIHGQKKTEKGEPSLIINLLNAAIRYKFLMKQLVYRDFMAKYKRSVLGVFWSFLNPLMTMSVQYVIFSTLFRSDTPYYAVYLLTGLVFFNFFSEASSLGITSIIGNASLIKKVYMPKYIYPTSRVVSSLVNLGFSMIPLFLVALISGVAIRASILLLIFDLLCLLMFVCGMVLILSTMMTFFQDTQFLWGVVSMMWMYMTPIFYPETIIPAKFLTIYHMNPMYQYITFARICIIDGVSPAPSAYLWCLISGAVVLIIGAIVFKRNQDKFILHI